jgi:RNA methyltransferase, TrmH family
MKSIKSISNPYIQHLIKLRQEKSYRIEKNLCLIAGNKIVNEVSKKHKLISLISNDPSLEIDHENTILVTEEIMKKITGLPSPENLAAEVEIPLETKISSEKFLVVLDKIKDPGNLGTIIRTAHGLCWDGIIITPDSVDPFNDKALRAAKGSTFFIPIFYKSSEDIEFLIKEKKITPYLADLKGKELSSCTFTKPLMLILSSESQGVGKWTKTIKNKITIPLAENIDSLNVAISGGILMYEIIEEEKKKNG